MGTYRVIFFFMTNYCERMAMVLEFPLYFITDLSMASMTAFYNMRKDTINFFKIISYRKFQNKNTKCLSV